LLEMSRKRSSKPDWSQLTEEEKQRVRDLFELLIEAERGNRLKWDRLTEERLPK
jgi:hypothetical protein